MNEMDLELFMIMNLLFDKNTQEQFLKECEELGIIEDGEEEN